MSFYLEICEHNMAKPFKLKIPFWYCCHQIETKILQFLSLLNFSIYCAYLKVFHYYQIKHNNNKNTTTKRKVILKYGNAKWNDFPFYVLCLIHSELIEDQMIENKIKQFLKEWFDKIEQMCAARKG